ncbi:uncharacterized protein [Montipora foliosa]|uniref:uncharacterized protein n=1 Tax=Montipora foliosa TaxID=591990 RepID=UPI0035F16C4E
MAGGHAFDALRIFCLFLFLSSTLHKETSPNDSALVFYPRFSILHRRFAALKLPAVKESKRGLLSLALPFNNHVTLPAYFAICCDGSSNPGPEIKSPSLQRYSRHELLDIGESLRCSESRFAIDSSIVQDLQLNGLFHQPISTWPVNTISDYDRQLIPTLISTPVGSNHEHQNSVNFANLIEVPLVNNYSYCSRVTTRITSRSFVPLKGINSRNQLNLIKPNYYTHHFTIFCSSKGYQFQEPTEPHQDLAIATETVIITGDFNFHVERPDANAMKFLDILDAGGFDQNVRGITHKHGHTLDLIITRQGDLIKTDPPKIVNGCFDISDHLPITCDVYIQKPPPTKKEISHRNLRNIDIEAWHNDLKKALSNPVSPINDVNIACGHFNQTLLHTMDKHAPIRTRLVTLRPYAPWFDDSLRSLKRRTQIQIDWSGNDLLTVKSAPPLPSHDSRQVLANSFADFFDNKIVSLKERLRSSNFVDNDLSIVINQPSCSSCFNNFSEVTVDQITKLIAKSKPKTSKLDPAPTGLIKQSVNIVAPFVTNIINASLTSGIFPTDLKKGLILPLLKKPSLDREELCNYRPITNLTFLSKLTGRVVASQMLAYLQSNSLLSKFQSAYRPLHSTETAILRVINDVQSAIDRREEVVLVLLDLSSAFDTIDHDALLTRLHTRYGISGTAIAWFRSYLVDRYQQVVIHGHSSRPVSLQFGVPQGSVLGPLLFALFFAPIEDIILAHGLKVMVYALVYADDTQLYISISSLDDRPSALSLLETCTRDILIWCTINGLACNPDKTEIIHLSSRFSKTPPIHAFNVNGYRISPSHSVRSLGVTLDRHLQMSQHVNMLCKSAFFSLKNISKIRKFLDRDNTERLVHAFISSKIDYFT